MTNSSTTSGEPIVAHDTLSAAQVRRIGYKIMFGVCEDPADVAARIDGVAVSPDVAECEDAAARKRWELTAPHHPTIRSAATWMAEVVADDVITEDDDAGIIESIKDEYAQDFYRFGVSLIGLLLEEGYLSLSGAQAPQ